MKSLGENTWENVASRIKEVLHLSLTVTYDHECQSDLINSVIICISLLVNTYLLKLFIWFVVMNCKTYYEWTEWALF